MPSQDRKPEELGTRHELDDVAAPSSRLIASKRFQSEPIRNCKERA